MKRNRDDEPVESTKSKETEEEDENTDETDKIRSANAITDYISHCKLKASYDYEDEKFQLSYLSAVQLSPAQKQEIFTLTKANVKEFYDSAPLWVRRSFLSCC